jgi:hypothetical protein
MLRQTNRESRNGPPRRLCKATGGPISPATSISCPAERRAILRGLHPTMRGGVARRVGQAQHPPTGTWHCVGGPALPLSHPTVLVVALGQNQMAFIRRKHARAALVMEVRVPLPCSMPSHHTLPRASARESATRRNREEEPVLPLLSWFTSRRPQIRLRWWWIQPALEATMAIRGSPVSDNLRR